MLDVEIAIDPIGTNTTSTSDYIAEAERVLKDQNNIDYKITGMSTEILGKDIDQIFDILKKMHKASFNKGTQRVSTSIRIDERRDKEFSLSDKVSSVQAKI